MLCVSWGKGREIIYATRRRFIQNVHEETKEKEVGICLEVKMEERGDEKGWGKDNELCLRTDEVYGLSCVSLRISF